MLATCLDGRMLLRASHVLVLLLGGRNSVLYPPAMPSMFAAGTKRLLCIRMQPLSIHIDNFALCPRPQLP